MSGRHAQRPQQSVALHPAFSAEVPAAVSGQALFSRRAISQAVFKKTLQQPYVLYPAAIGILGTLSALLLGAGWISIASALFGFGIALSAWGIDYHLRRDYHAAGYLAKLHHSLSQQREQFLGQLESDLQQLALVEGLSQLNRLQQRYRAFEQLLQRKLHPGEITYSRYLGMAEQLYLSALDNLQRVAHVTQGLGSMHDAFMRRRIAELQAFSAPNPAQQQELAALQARLQLRKEQSERVEAWLAQNEEAMTQLDLTMAAIAEMNTVAGQASIEMESAMAELQHLVARSTDYNRTP